MLQVGTLQSREGQPRSPWWSDSFLLLSTVKFHRAYKFPVVLVQVQILIQCGEVWLRLGISNKLPRDDNTVTWDHTEKSEAPANSSGDALSSIYQLVSVQAQL